MTTNLLILSFYFVFCYRLCANYSYGFIIIFISHGIYVVFFVIISDITSPTLIVVIIVVIIIIIIIITVIINNYWLVITVITSTTIITDIVHIICAVTITIFNWDFKYKNIGISQAVSSYLPSAQIQTAKLSTQATSPTGIPRQSTGAEVKPSKVGLC